MTLNSENPVTLTNSLALLKRIRDGEICDNEVIETVKEMGILVNRLNSLSETNLSLIGVIRAICHEYLNGEFTRQKAEEILKNYDQ